MICMGEKSGSENMNDRDCSVESPVIANNIIGYNRFVCKSLFYMSVLSSEQ